MVNHLVERDGQRRFVPGHYVGRRIPDEDHVHAGTFDDAGHRIVVCGEHRDFLAPGLHFGEAVGGDHPGFAIG